MARPDYDSWFPSKEPIGVAPRCSFSGCHNGCVWVEGIQVYGFFCEDHTEHTEATLQIAAGRILDTWETNGSAEAIRELDEVFDTLENHVEDTEAGWEDNVRYQRVTLFGNWPVLYVWVAVNMLDGFMTGPCFTRWGARRCMNRYVHGLRI